MMRILDRCGALTGAAYVLLVMVGNTMSTGSPGPHPAHPTGEQDIASLRWLAGSASGQAGVTLELLGFAAYVLRDGISPEMARVLTDMNSAAFVVDWLPTGMFVACAAGAALAARTLGRILGWGGVVAGSGAVIVTAITGVHVLTANALPFLLCLLWILLVSVRLAVQRTSRMAAEPAPDLAPASV
jgi:hypothetical protein